MKILPFFTVLSLSLFVGGLASLERFLPSSVTSRAEVSSNPSLAPPAVVDDPSIPIAADPVDVRSGVMPAYFRGKLLSMTYTMWPVRRDDRTFVNGRPARRIFVCDSGLPGDRPFLSVIDAAPSALFGPPWLETKVRFRPGHTPRQIHSAEEIEAAAERGEVALDYSSDVYRCEEADTR
jgi:hypothetical protein